MRRYAGGLALAGFAAVLVGCTPAKELPTDVPAAEVARDSGSATQAKSDPDAKAAADRAVAAFTGNQPERLAKVKASRLTMKVQVIGVTEDGRPINTARKTASVWPDRFWFADHSDDAAARPLVELWMRRPDLHILKDGGEFRVPNPVEREYNFASDVIGQVWMPLLLPLADAKAVVYDLQTETPERRDQRSVKLNYGNHPTYQLTFDAKTDALVRAEYKVTEFGVPLMSAVVFSDHRRGADGLLLPYQVEYLRNKVTREKWAIDKWEFPESIKDDEFSPPAPKK